MNRAFAPIVFLTAACFAFAALPTDPVPKDVAGNDVAGKTLLYINGYYYQPFSTSLLPGTKVYMDAESSLLRATQRSLGYREVDYKKLFFDSLTFTAVSPDTDSLGNVIYNYGSLSTSSTLAGYWTKKNLPIVLGPASDPNGYITDGHHTTAGYLATPGKALIAGTNHIVLGTTVVNPSSATSAGDQMWADFSSVNNAYLYGTSGNQLAQPSDNGYAGLQPIMPSTTAMPTTPGKASMANDLYRSLAWGAVDAIVKTATNASGAKIAGFLKVDSTSTAASKPDVNFVEFFWADFLRNRVMWNDNATLTSSNLISAPVSFFAATANAIALSKSELYADQFGRSLLDYTNSIYSQNTQTWANASLLNGLAVSGDTYNMFLTDDATVQGDLIASGVEGVVTNLSINTTSGTIIAGALQNFSSIAVNTGGTMSINWKDSAVNAVTQNTTLSIPAGTGDVTFAGNNDFTKLSSLTVGAGTLTIDSTNSTVDQTIWGVISGSGKLRKTGQESLTLSGANTISGGVYLDQGVLVLASASVLDGSTLISSPIGVGTLWVKDGTTLGFEESVRLLNRINVAPASDAVGVTIDVGDNSVELAGRLSTSGSLVITGQQTSVLTFSGTSEVTGKVLLEALTLRLSNASGVSPESFTLSSGASIQAGSDATLSSEIILVDDGKLDAGESLFDVTGTISGDGRLTIAGHPYGTVRLSGLNTYTGGTMVDRARVEVGQGGADDATGEVGSGRVFGTGSVTLNAGILGFADSAQIPNDLVLSGNATVDVGSYSAELSGPISGDGSLLVTGAREGSLFLSQSENFYTGTTAVEGTTLRISSSAGRKVFGDSTTPVYLNEARLLITPDLVLLGTIGSFGSRGLEVGALGATLDVGDNDVQWSGEITGYGKLVVGASKGNSVELSGNNSYKGGTEIIGGGNLVFSRDANLGDSGGAVIFTEGGLVYSGTQALTFGRPLKVGGVGMLDMGSKTVTVMGAISGAGVLEVGQSGSTGTLVLGASSASFSGDLILSGGSLSVSHIDALKGATIEVPAAGGVLKFTTSEASLGGLSGDGSVALPESFKLNIGATDKSSTFLGSISGTGAALTKVGSGRFTLAGATDVASVGVSSGELALGVTGTLTSTVKLSLSKGASLSVVGTHNLVGNFSSTNLDLISTAASIVFDGPVGSELRLPKAVVDRVSLLNSGSGTILAVSASGEISIAQNKLGAGSEVTVSKVLISTSVDNGSKINMDSSSGPVNIRDFSGLKGGGVDTLLTLPATGVLNYSTSLTGFLGTLLTDGTVNVTSLSANGQTALLPIKGSASINVVAGGSVKFATSPDYTGTTLLGVGAVAELSGSLNKNSTFNLSASSVVNVNPSGAVSLVMPSLAGSGGLVSLNSGSVQMSGNSANFGGTVVVERGVSVTVTGNLPKGTVQLKDPTVPMKVDTSAGGVYLPGTVGGDGVLAVSGTGKMTLGASASIKTAELRIGTSATDRPILDVSQISSGLVLDRSQTLAGGGTIVGSLRTSGTFKPGNSPGVFTVAKSTATFSGGDLYLDASSVTEIEYGMRADNSRYEWDQVVLAGTLTVANGAKIVAKPYIGTDSRGVTFINGVMPSSLRLEKAFTAGSLSLGNVVPELANPSYLFSARFERSGSNLDLVIERANYGQKVGSSRLQNLGAYLSAAPDTALTAPFASLINVLDSSTNQAQLEAALQAISSSVYSEAQRLSVHRTSAITETVQRRLIPNGMMELDGWSAWSEAYGWSLHKNSAGLSGSWNGSTFGGVMGVQKTFKGLTLGILGASGHSSATLSNPGSSLSVDSYHGGSYANIDLGVGFINGGFVAGSADQSVKRDVSLAGLGGTARSKFQSSEYSVHLGGGLKFDNVGQGFSFIPSVSIVSSGVVQDGSTETGAGPLSVSTNRKTLNVWQTRTGAEASRKFKVNGAGLSLSSSAHWVHDFSGKPLATSTRFTEASSSMGTYQSLGSRIGADAFEIGAGAALDLSERTSVRLNGNWQIRDGSHQPGASVGVSVRF